MTYEELKAAYEEAQETIGNLYSKNVDLRQVVRYLEEELIPSLTTKQCEHCNPNRELVEA